MLAVGWTSLIVFAVDWTSFTGGSILNGVLVAAALAGAAFYVIRSVKRDNAETSEQAVEAYKHLYEATQAELNAEREARAAISEALDEAREEASNQKAEIAGLRAMPDTSKMLQIFETHHSENQQMMRLMIENQTAAMPALKTMGDGITRLLERNRDKRVSDE